MNANARHARQNPAPTRTTRKDLRGRQRAFSKGWQAFKDRLTNVTVDNEDYAVGRSIRHTSKEVADGQT